VIFPEYFGENLVILLRMVAEWWCIKLCAIFLAHSVQFRKCPGAVFTGVMCEHGSSVSLAIT